MMNDERKTQRREIWTFSQRKALLGLSVILLMFLSIEAYRKPVLISDPPPISAARADEIRDRLDPNTADATALSAIPNLGENRAREIVEYRENFVRQHPEKLAFASPEDFTHIKGIGPAISSNLGNYLVFPQKLTRH